MIGWLKKVHEMWAIPKWLKSPLGSRVLNDTVHAVREDPILSQLSSASNQLLIKEILEEAYYVQGASDAQQLLRHRIAELVYSCSELYVLALTKEEKLSGDDAGCDQISGELHKEIVRASGESDQLQSLRVHKPEIDHDGLKEFCAIRVAKLSQRINALNILRIEFGDFEEPDDWLRPFGRSMSIWHEAQFRERLGMADLVGPLDKLMHSTFFQIVNSGAPKPYEQWRAQWNVAGDT